MELKNVIKGVIAVDVLALVLIAILVSSSFIASASASLNGNWIPKNNTTFAGGYGEAVVGTEDYIYIAKCYRIDYDPYFARYEPANDTWSAMSVDGFSKGEFRNGLSLEWDRGDYIYALLGARYPPDDTNRRLFYRYSISNGSWEQLAVTPHAQGAGNALTWSEYDGRLYAFIGSREHVGGSKFTRYDPINKTWQVLSFNPSWRYPKNATDDGASLVSIKSEIYALRGEIYETDPKGYFAKYNVSTDTWMDLTPLSEKQGVGDGGSLLYIGDWLEEYDDYIFALQGGSGTKGEDPGYNFYIYSISQNRWVILDPILCPVGWYVGNRFGFADGHIYYWQGSPQTDRWICGGDAFYMYEFADISATRSIYTADDCINPNSTKVVVWVRLSNYGLSGELRETLSDGWSYVDSMPNATITGNDIIFELSGEDFAIYHLRAPSTSGVCGEINGTLIASDLRSYSVEGESIVCVCDCGDLNSDGIVNMTDVYILLGQVANHSDYESAGDVNRDGKVNMGDVILLLNYVNDPEEYEIGCCDTG